MAKASYIPDRKINSLPDRAPTSNSNPIAIQPGSLTRETYPMTRGATPRYQHPKLNVTPWSTAYAVKRDSISKGKAKKVRKG